jgi:hypothetical protein
MGLCINVNSRLKEELLLLNVKFVQSAEVQIKMALRMKSSDAQQLRIRYVDHVHHVQQAYALDALARVLASAPRWKTAKSRGSWLMLRRSSS